MIVQEGLTKLVIPKSYLSKIHFFNPKVEMSRDFSILILNTLRSKGWLVCDALAGTGARGIRIAKETQVKEVWINDWSKDALKYAEKSIALNRVKGKVKIFNKDAKILLAENKRTFDHVDIDPFGSPIYYFDACAEAVKRKSLLGFAATDTAPLSGVNPLTCLRRYGTRSLRTDFFKELGLRILLGATALLFSRYFFSIRPILSYSSEHYYRVWLKLEKKRSKTTESLKRDLGHLSYCSNCLWRSFGKELKKKCEYCGSDCKVVLNIWLGEIEDERFIEDCSRELEKLEWLRTREKISRLLKLLKNENIIFYYDIHELCRKLKMRVPSFDLLIEELKSIGYEAKRTHFSKTSIKTNAELKDLIDVLQTVK